MKRIGLFGVLGIIAVLVIAVVMAGKMGKTSAAFARGKVVLADHLKDQAKGTQALFIIVYDPSRPMPFGAFRKTISTDPEGDVYDFVLTYDSVQRMMPSAEWPATFRLKARLDKDGSAGPDQPGDLVGELNNVQRGADNLVLTIDTEVK